MVLKICPACGKEFETKQPLWRHDNLSKGAWYDNKCYKKSYKKRGV